MTTNNLKISYEFKDKFINDMGIAIYRGDSLYKLLLNGKSIDVEVETSNDIELYNNIIENYGITNKRIEIYSCDADFADIHEDRIKEWNMPINYLNLDLLDYFKSFDLNDTELQRVAEELVFFEKYNCNDVLRFLIYLIDVFKQNDIVWGVGRGSSVASYCLYLIGVHKINPIKYNLDMDEFFKEK